MYFWCSILIACVVAWPAIHCYSFFMYFLLYFDIFFFSLFPVMLYYSYTQTFSLILLYCWYTCSYCMSFWALLDGVCLSGNKRITYLLTYLLTYIPHIPLSLPLTLCITRGWFTGYKIRNKCLLIQVEHLWYINRLHMTVCFIHFIVCGTAAGTDHVILMQSTASQYWLRSYTQLTFNSNQQARFRKNVYDFGTQYQRPCTYVCRIICRKPVLINHINKYSMWKTIFDYLWSAVVYNFVRPLSVCI